jgi:hypothetical protein
MLLLPRQNDRDFLEDVPPELRDELEVVFVDTAEEVLQYALEPAAEAPTRKNGSGGRSKGKAAAAKSGSGPRAARGKAGAT